MPLNRNRDAKRRGCARNLLGPKKRLRRAGERGAGSGRRRATGSVPVCPCFPGSSRIPPGRSREPGKGISAPDCPNAILVRWSRTNQELCLDICSRDFNSTGGAPGRCFGAEEEGRTFPGLGAPQGNRSRLQPGEALARISRKLKKPRRRLRTAQRCRGRFAPNASNIGRVLTGPGSPGPGRNRAGTGQGPGRDGRAEPGTPALRRGRSRERRAGAPALRLHPALSFWYLYFYFFFKLRFNFI